MPKTTEEQREIENQALYRIYSSIWQNINREDELVNQRILRSILLSSGLLVTSGVLANFVAKENAGKTDLFIDVLFLLLMIGLSVVGAYFSNYTAQGVKAAHNQSQRLIDHYFNQKDENGKNKLETRLNLPQPFGGRRDSLSGNSSAEVFPKMMIIIWAVLGIIEICFASVAIVNLFR